MDLKCLADVFGIKPDVKKIKLKGLPFFLSSRSAYQVNIIGITFLLVEIIDEQFGSVALKKQLSKYTKAPGMCVAYSIDNMSRKQRKALIMADIPFISLPNQIYLPFLGIALNDRFKKKTMASQDKMMPATQCLFLYLLYNGEKEYVLKKDAAEALKLTRTSITRASEQLRIMGLIKETAHGKEIRMHCTSSGRELFEAARDHLINPVQKVLTVRKPFSEGLTISGESALSKISMLGGPDLPVYAINKNDIRLSNIEQVDPRWEDTREVCVIELWKYDPSLFSKDNAVDPVSLALSLASTDDERVQGELERYLEDYAW